MHPEILRELTAQRSRELQARAHQATRARAAAKIARIGRRGHRAPGQADELVMPAVPDYVDGSFHTEPADGAAASQPGQAAAAHHAA